MSDKDAIKAAKKRKDKIDAIELILGHINEADSIDYTIQYSNNKKSILINLK